MPMGPVSVKIDSTVLKRKLAAADPKIRSNIAKQLNRLGTMTASNIRAGMNRDTGYMANHVEPVHATPNNLTEIIKAGAKYTNIQDNADKATGGKRWFPPPDALVKGGWAGRHNPGTDRKGNKMSDASFAFLVARAIKEKGIKPHNFIDPVITPAKAEALRFMKDALKGIW